MLMNLLKGGLVGGLILFAYSALSWMVLPWHSASMQGFPNEAAVLQAIGPVHSRAIYLLPDPQSTNKPNAPAPQGPSVFIAVAPSVITNMVPSMAVGLVSGCICALLVTWILLQTSGLSYTTKLLLFVLVGLVMGLGANVDNWSWWQFSSSYTLAGIADALIGWTLAGLALAKLVKTA